MIKNSIPLPTDGLEKRYFSFVKATESGITDYGWQVEHSQPSTVVRFVRAKKMTTVDLLFSEFSAALQFPYYFGENWNAFRDCLLDLSWLDGDRYVIVITDANSLLKEDLEQLQPFLDYLHEAANDFQLQNKVFVVVFQFIDRFPSTIVETMKHLGIDFVEEAIG